MKTVVIQWAKANSVMLVNALSLVGTTAVTLALGFAYWWLAARLFSPAAIGLGSAAISAMTLLATFCILGLGTLLIGELPRQRGKEASLISTALILVGGVGGGAGIVFAIAAPFVSANFQALRASVQDIALFAIGVSLTAITLVLDQALIGLLRGELQFWRNTVFAAVKLAAIFTAGLWLADKVGLTIYATWALGNALSLAALAIFAVLKGNLRGRACWPQWDLLRKLGPAALQHHLLNLTLQAPSLALPVLVTVLLSATANAWFYVSWMVASLAALAPYVLTTVLYATNAAEPAELARKARLTIGLAIVTSVLANCVLQLGTRQVLSLFGPAYADQATWCLRFLALAAFPRIIKDHYVAVCRIQGRIARAALPMMVGGLLELSIAAFGARLGGVAGLSLGWVIALCFEAAFGFRTVYKAVRFKDTSTAGDQLKEMSINRVMIEQSLSNFLLCTSCNSKLPPHASFCGTCGERAGKRVDNLQLIEDPEITEIRIEAIPRRTRPRIPLYTSEEITGPRIEAIPRQVLSRLPSYISEEITETRIEAVT